MFHMTSVLGRFEVTEILPDQMRNAVVNPLLFNQAHLYEAEQPGETALSRIHWDQNPRHHTTFCERRQVFSRNSSA